LGRNGAGKSTTLRTIMGLTPASSGSILLAGKPIEKAQPYEIARSGAGFVPEDQAVIYSLSVEENMRLAMLEENDAVWQRMSTIFQLFPDLKKFGRPRRACFQADKNKCLP
jgi:branched-chain amino acid transport system ATP-binding protein